MCVCVEKCTFKYFNIHIHHRQRHLHRSFDILLQSPSLKKIKELHIYGWMPSVSRQSTATPNNIQENIYSIVCCCISTTLNTAVPSMLLTIPFPVNERANVFCCSPIFFSHPGGSKPPSSYRNIINFCLFLLNVAAPFLWSHLLLLLLPPKLHNIPRLLALEMIRKCFFIWFCWVYLLFPSC